MPAQNTSCLWTVLILLCIAATAVNAQACSAGTRPGCGDGTSPTCPDGSAPDPTASSPCANNAHPQCADGNSIQCISTDGGGNTPDTSGSGDSTLCAADGSSSNAKIVIEGSDRIVTSNSCPNHKWRKINPNDALKQAFLGASASDFKIKLPAAPTLAPSGQEFNVECVGGAVGVARSGPMIFSPFPGTSCPGDAVALEGDTFDECNGHAAQRGDYHYHMTPTCTLKAVGGDVATKHDPILGYMADGIPIYGPRAGNGSLPKDLDSCGGHASDEGNGGQYHYHFQAVTGTWPDPATPFTSAVAGTVGAGYPYTVKCLKGCISDTVRASFPGSTTFPSLSYADCLAQGTKLNVAESTPGDGNATTTSSGVGAAHQGGSPFLLLVAAAIALFM